MRAGGWGFAISDEGSGQWIGRTAVSEGLRARDEGRSSTLLDVVADRWHVEGVEELVRMANGTPPPNFSDLFPVVTDLSDSHDDVAAHVLKRAGAELSKLVKIVIDRLFADGEGVRVAMSGGVFRRSPIVVDVFYNEVRAHTPQAGFQTGVVEAGMEHSACAATRYCRWIALKGWKVSEGRRSRRALTCGLMDELIRERIGTHASLTDSAGESADGTLDAEWMRAAADPALTEDRALGLLKEAGLSGDALEVLRNNKQLMKSRKVRLALVKHPNAPRHVSVPALRQLFTFDLMNVALAPLVPADVKMAAEDVLLLKMETISSGERLSLARRASGRVAGVLLLDAELAHCAAARKRKVNGSLVAKAVLRANAPSYGDGDLRSGSGRCAGCASGALE
jgi:hypothetical protein